MIQNPSYVLRRIAKVPYLLPVGQMIADHHRGMRINETGVYLWKLLKTEQTLDTLLDACVAHFEAQPDDIPALRTDIEHFVTQLKAYGILLSSLSADEIQTPYYKSLQIAGLVCALYIPAAIYPIELEPFVCERCTNADIHIELLPYIPPVHENGMLLLQNPELTVTECKDKFILHFPSFQYVKQIHLQKDGKYACYYCQGPYEDDSRQEFFHATRHVYLYLAQQHHMVALHSASILYKGKAWLFSASSGTGKSTHAGLWQELYDVSAINGDLNLIAMESLPGTADTDKANVSLSRPVVHGIPWCGTSGICDTKTHPLGGIILLKRGNANYTQTLKADEKRLLVLQRLISPSWTTRQFDRNLKAVNASAPHILICRLFCTPAAEAAKVMKETIDKYLHQSF